MLVDQATGCWNWTGHVGNTGYGLFRILRPDGSTLGTTPHRVMAWLVFGDEAVRGLHVCHRCDNRRCMNPSHLFLGTDADNSADAKRKGRLRVLRGSARREAKLSEAKVREIRCCRSGETHRDLAREFGVSRGRIGHVVQRRAWRHVL